MKPLRIALVAFLCVMTVFTIVGFSAQKWQAPPVASKAGEGIDAVINYLLICTGVVLVIGNAGLIWLILRYSNGSASGYKPESSKTQWMVALVPVACMAGISEIGVLVIGGPAWNNLYGTPPVDAMQVEVVGKQFEWFVHYPGKDGKFGKFDPHLVREPQNLIGLVEEDLAATDDIVVRGVLRVPVGRDIVVHLRTIDVQHSFLVPAFRVKQDLVAGMPTQTRFLATKVGKYEIVCSQLCGLGHYKMRGEVIVMEPKEFEAWLAEQVGQFE